MYLKKSYTTVCQPVRGDNPRIGLLFPVMAENRGITILYH